MAGDFGGEVSHHHVRCCSRRRVEGSIGRGLHPRRAGDGKDLAGSRIDHRSGEGAQRSVGSFEIPGDDLLEVGVGAVEQTPEHDVTAEEHGRVDTPERIHRHVEQAGSRRRLGQVGHSVDHPAVTACRVDVCDHIRRRVAQHQIEPGVGELHGERWSDIDRCVGHDGHSIVVHGLNLVLDPAALPRRPLTTIGL